MSLERALSGIRVIDLTHYIAGPYCTKLLGDYGAEVIKIEPPAGGEGGRTLPPFFDDQPGRGGLGDPSPIKEQSGGGLGDPSPTKEQSGLFCFLNTSKQSVAIDLTCQPGREAVLGLIERADVVVENFRPGTLERLGLGQEVLRAANPRLVSVAISNFGASGPYRDYRMTDSVAFALGSWTYPMGELDRPPVQPGGAFGQYLAGLYAAIGTLQAVRNRNATQAAQHVEVSIQEALIATSLYDFVAFSYSGFVRQRSGKQFHAAFPNLVTLPCADGYVGVHAGLPHQIVALLELIERPDLAGDPRFQNISTLALCAEELHTALIPWMRDRKKWDIYHAAQARGIPLSPIPSAQEVVEWAQLKERQAFIEVEGPGGGTVSIPGPPSRESGQPILRLQRAPRVGEHTTSVLGEKLGYGNADLQHLRAAGAIN